MRNSLREMRASCFIFLQQYNYVAGFYNVDGAMIFDVAAKTHMLAHIALTCHEISPRRTWCFSGERLILFVRRLGQSSCRGIKAHEIGRKLLTKYLCGLHLLLTDACEWFSEDEMGDALSSVDGAELELCF